jgi:hypothetical protein
VAPGKVITYDKTPDAPMSGKADPTLVGKLDDTVRQMKALDTATGQNRVDILRKLEAPEATIREAEQAVAKAGKIGFQNEDTLNAALKAQGKAESGKAVAPKPLEQMTMTELKALGKEHGIAPARSQQVLRNRIREAAKKPDAPKSLTSIVGNSLNKLGTVAMIAAPAIAAAVAYDATKAQAQAAGADPTAAAISGLKAGAAAGGITAGLFYGAGKVIGAGIKVAAKVAPAAAGPVGWAVIGGMTAYGAYSAYQAYKDKGTGVGLAAAAASLVGAQDLAHFAKDKGTERNLSAGPQRLDSAQAAKFKATSATYDAMQATENKPQLTGFQLPHVQAKAQAAQGHAFTGMKNTMPGVTKP